MKAMRLLILGTAVAAGAGAAIMVATARPPRNAKQMAVHKVASDEVLVAAKNLTLGQVIKRGDLRWQRWPKDNVPPRVIRRSRRPRAIAQSMGAFVRNAIGVGEPVYPNWLVKPGSASFMAAVLPAGMRAVAINIDQRGSTTAGGFIHSGDRVDVIQTYRNEQLAKSGANPTVSRTLLRNVKVLAIGKNIREPNKERMVAGSNATLEVTPTQAEILIRAQRVGQLSLTLRSIADKKVSEADPPTEPDVMTIVRFGVPSQVRAQ